jgi:hypothetical protein
MPLSPQTFSRENGKPVADARDNDLRFLTGVFRFFGALSTNCLAAIFMTAAAFTRQRFWSLSASSEQSFPSTGRRFTPGQNRAGSRGG